MNLQMHHLVMLLQYKEWAPPAVQFNMPAPHPGTLIDLFEHGLIDRDDKWNVVLTTDGEAAVQAAIQGMRSVARNITA